MLKLSYSKEKGTINVNKLHDELALSETFYLTHDDESFYLTFPDIKEVVNEVMDGETVIDTIVEYHKRFVEPVMEIDAEGNETLTDVETWVAVEFENTIAQIESTITSMPQIQESAEMEKLLMPSTEEINKANRDIETIGLLMDLGVI